MTVAEALALGERTLPARPGLPDPRREARWLLARALGRSETWLLLHPDQGLPDEAVAGYRGWLERRRAGEPAHHLVGSCPFWGREMRVTPSTLVPRPETELLVATALALPLPASARVADVGTGCGCIAATLAAERPGWRVVATDRSLAAARVAAANLARHAPAVGLVVADLATALAGPLDLVVANLPYLPTAALPALPLEVRHDPVAALDGGDDGLDAVRRLLADAGRWLGPAGFVALELGEGQAGAAAAWAAGHGLEERQRVRDLGGCDRVLVLQRPARGRPRRRN